MRLKGIIRDLYRYVVVSAAMAVMLLITVYNAKMTSYLVKWEVTYYVRDNVFVNLFSVCMAVVFLLIFRRSRMYRALMEKMADDRCFSRVRFLLLLIIFLEAAFWAISTQFIPGVDEGEIQQFVSDFMRKDYSMFAPGGYMCRSADNRGLFLFECGVSVIFGHKNYLVYELINSFAVAMIYRQFSEMLEGYGFHRGIQLSAILTGIFFFPLIGYSIMVYGNLMGIALGVTAVKYELRFFSDMEWRNACRCALFITLAVLLKSNMLIYLIAIMLAALLHGILSRRKEILCLMILLVLGWEMQSAIPTYIFQNMTGYELDTPYSYWSFIAMGLQESELAPGWWNGYIHSNYWENDGDTQMQTAAAKESVCHSVEQFAQDPQYAFSFFTKKIASTWANPTFQCFATVRNGSNIEVPVWVLALLSYPGQYVAAAFFHLLTFLILVGAMTELMLSCHANHDIDRLIFPMILTGGFFFHLFWEAKARYALLYFVVLIPYALMGYADLTGKIESLHFTSVSALLKSGRDFCARRRCFMILFGVLLSVYLYCYSDSAGGRILTEHTEEYAVYLGEELQRITGAE